MAIKNLPNYNFNRFENICSWVFMNIDFKIDLLQNKIPPANMSKVNIWKVWISGYLLGKIISLEEEMATHSSILVWEISQIEGLAGYSPGDHRVRHDLATRQLFASFSFLCPAPSFFSPFSVFLYDVSKCSD